MSAFFSSLSERSSSSPFMQPFQEAIDYFRQKVNLPSKTYADLQGRAHDRNFVVAGATKEELLNDLNAAVDDALAKGVRLEDFTKQFDEIVTKAGWTQGKGLNTQAGRAWRARTIYETNLRTAYAAGRYKQMTDPDMKKLRPFWQYKHGYIRKPKAPRSSHLSLDGLILHCDDPAWAEIYPPNGWGCTCGVVPLSKRQMERLGRTEADPSPNFIRKRVFDPLTGESELVPQGVSAGWNHAPGKDWTEGLIPKELQKPLPASADTPSGGSPPPKNLVLLREIARPSKAPDLPEGKPAEWYVDKILGLVGAKRGADGAKLIRDKAGQVVAVSDSMFKTGDGRWKVFKQGRASSLLKAFEALIDPDEIWVDWEKSRDTGNMMLKRRYLRYDPNLAVFSAFTWGKDGWGGSTLFPTRGSSGKRESYIEAQRHGALLFRRKK